MPQFILECEINGDMYVEEGEGSFTDATFELDENGNLWYEPVEGGGSDDNV